MDFEFDPTKSTSNKRKHGIDCIALQELWADERRLQIQAKGTLDEPRWALIGVIESICWTAIFTTRKLCIRIISLRRAREEKKELYYGE
jgi:uncharacterized DUF497 family protein